MSEIMATDLASSPDGMRIARAIEYLTDNFEMQPSLDDAAREAGLSSYHFQRMFTRFVGISPKKFVQHLTLNRAKESLAASASVLTRFTTPACPVRVGFTICLSYMSL